VVVPIALGLFIGIHNDPPSMKGKSTPAYRNLSSEEMFGGSTKYLLSRIRDKNSEQATFVLHTDRLIRLVMEVALASVDKIEVPIETPTGGMALGYEYSKPIAGVAVLRSGDAFLTGFNQILPGAKMGKLLMVKHDTTSAVQVIYSKMPKNLSSSHIFLMDPMMATGETITKGIKVLMDDHDVKEDQITILTLISCPDAIKHVFNKYPNVKLITATIDEVLDEQGWINPGLGVFGE